MTERSDENAGESSRQESGDSDKFDPTEDQYAPPAEPCECWCLHCQRTFMSTEIWFQKVINARSGFTGFWMCPTPNCSGAGFTFDIFPTDPAHPANEGWSYDDDDDVEDDEPWDEEELGAIDGAEENAEWNPDEPKYKELDEIMPEDDDIAGEEWKYGLEPGAPAPNSHWSEEAREEWEEEQRKYDQPDERPRIVDWSNREERGFAGGDDFDEDDIPF